MKKNILLALLLVATTLSLGAQTLKLHQKNGITVLVNADEAGEMIVAGSQISVGQEVFDITNLDSLTYASTNFDPQLVELNYAEQGATLSVPLALLPMLTINKDGAYVSLTSTASADPEIIYSAQGKSSDGGLVLEGTYKCGVILNGLDLTSKRGAAIHIRNGKRIDVEMPEGTVNRLEDCAGGEQSACFHIKGHPEFKGGGSLYITGNTRHAFKSGEYTEIKPSTGLISIQSAQGDAMHIGQYFHLRGGQIEIGNGVKDDGIQVEKDLDPTKENNGMMFLDSGIVNITLTSDTVSAIKCDSTLYCNGGQYTINVSGKGSKCINAPYDAYVRATYTTPEFNLTATGGRLMVGTDKKNSSCFKVDGDLYLHTGNFNIHISGEKTKGLKIGNILWYVPAKTSLIQNNVTTSPANSNAVDVGNSIRVLSE